MRYSLLAGTALMAAIAVGLTFLVGLNHQSDRATGTSYIYIGNGRAALITRATRSNGFAVPERYSASILQLSGRQSGSPWWPIYESTPGGSRSVSLAWPAAGLVLLTLLVHLLRWRIYVRRRAAGGCSQCGYDLRESSGVCPECGAAGEVARASRSAVTLLPRVGEGWRIVSIAAVEFLAIAIGICVLMRWTGHLEYRAEERSTLASLNVPRFWLATSPRLSGQVVHPAGKTITAFEASNGAMVLLDTGEYRLQPTSRLTDLAIVGRSPEETRLRLHLNAAARVRLENVTIDCNDDPFVEFRTGGTLSLRNCRIINYDSGAGGSSAIDGSEATIWMEDCTMDGSGGRQMGRSFGVAFDLRGNDDQVFARRVHFSNHQEISREPCVTFDDCSIGTDQPRARQYPLYAIGARYARSTTLPSNPLPVPTPSVNFAFAMDDLELVRAVASNDASNAGMRRLIDCFEPRDDPGYWLPLLRSPSAATRQIAAEQLTRLKHPPHWATPASEVEVPALLDALNSAKAEEVLAARVRLLAASAEVWPVIERAGSPAAAELDRLRALPTPFEAEVEFTRIAKELGEAH